MEYAISIYFLVFIIYSIAGWIMEVVGKSIESKRFVNRGFLIGPYCPIYGCGAVIITILLKKYVSDWLILFVMAIFTCGILEYLTSYIMEKIFHARWWDYSEKRYNVNGRICLETLIPFGILGLIIMYVGNPFILSNLNKIPENILNIISIILFVIFLVDGIISIKVISNIRATSTKLRNEENLEDNTEEITKQVKEILLGKSVFNRRLINAYPDLQTVIKKKKEEIKQRTDEIKQNIKDKTQQL